nr:MAG TPA: hypothetical protein [Bacteriophage sp.]
MNYTLIIYLVGVLINSYLVIGGLKDKYNAGKVITIGDFLENIVVCSTSWLLILGVLIAWLCVHISIIVRKPLFRKHK